MNTATVFAELSAWVFGVICGVGVCYVLWVVIPRNKKKTEVPK